MMLPTARHSLPPVSVPSLRAMKVALYVDQDGETVSVPEGVSRSNNAASVARTVRPGRK
jgi:hypothetical protein